MRLFEAIMDANQRALRGDKTAGVRIADYANSLPIAALTCIDPRLNPLVPEVFGINEEDFIWLRNAGNIITSPLSSTLRSLALACALKGAKEIAIVGHTDCKVRQTTVMELTDRLKKLGLDRVHLPENLTEFFGLFASERQNVIKGAEIVRRSPIISPKIPVHGLLLDIQTGALEWLVNGYQTLGAAPFVPAPMAKLGEDLHEAWSALATGKIGDTKLSEMKIGEAVHKVESVLTHAKEAVSAVKEEVAKTKAQRLEKPPVAHPPSTPRPKPQR